MTGPSTPINHPGITSPFGLLRFAYEYQTAARLVENGRERDMDLVPPRYMLIGQSIELSLKAYLLARGVSLRDLKFKYGHDLRALLDTSMLKRIDRLVKFQEFDLQTIRVLADGYGTHEFRYIVTGFRTLPTWSFAYRAANLLTDSLHDWLLRKRIGKEQALLRITERGRF